MIYEKMNTSIICIQCSCSKMYSVKQLSEKVNANGTILDGML